MVGVEIIIIFNVFFKTIQTIRLVGFFIMLIAIKKRIQTF